MRTIFLSRKSISAVALLACLVTSAGIYAHLVSTNARKALFREYVSEFERIGVVVRTTNEKKFSIATLDMREVTRPPDQILHALRRFRGCKIDLIYTPKSWTERELSKFRSSFVRRSTKVISAEQILRKTDRIQEQ